MNKNHYCTLEQHQELWDFGIRIRAVGNPLLSCGELLDLLPDIIYIDHIEYELTLYKDDNYKNENLWGLFYLNKIGGDPIYQDFGINDTIYLKSLAQLAADRLIWLLEEEIITVNNILELRK